MSAWDEALKAHTHQLIDRLQGNEAGAASEAVRRLRRFIEETQHRLEASTVLQILIELVLNPSLIHNYKLDEGQPEVTSDLIEILCEYHEEPVFACKNDFFDRTHMQAVWDRAIATLCA